MINLKVLIFLIVSCIHLQAQKVFDKKLLDVNNYTVPDTLFKNVYFLKELEIDTSFRVFDYLHNSSNFSLRDTSFIISHLLLGAKTKALDVFNRFKKLDYTGFNSNFPYKAYREFVGTGTYILYKDNVLFFVQISSCVDEKIKKNFEDFVKLNWGYSVLRLNCGGNKLVEVLN